MLYVKMSLIFYMFYTPFKKSSYYGMAMCLSVRFCFLYFYLQLVELWIRNFLYTCRFFFVFSSLFCCIWIWILVGSLLLPTDQVQLSFWSINYFVELCPLDLVIFMKISIFRTFCWIDGSDEFELLRVLSSYRRQHFFAHPYTFSN